MICQRMNKCIAVLSPGVKSHMLKRKAKNILYYKTVCRLDSFINGFSVPVYVCRHVRNTNILPGTCINFYGKGKGCSYIKTLALI